MKKDSKENERNEKHFEIKTRFISAKNAAKMLCVSYQHILNLIKIKKLRAAQVGAHKHPRYIIELDDLERFIRAAKRSAGIKTATHENDQDRPPENGEKVKKAPPGVGSFKNRGFRRGAAAGSHTSAISPHPPHSTSNTDTHNPSDINE